MRKIVLAYSGGLDTSIILRWLQENYNAEVIAYTSDIGQEINRKKIITNAKRLGVKKIIIEDLKNAISRIAPEDIEYIHNLKWGDGNGFSHVRSAILGPSISIPINDGLLRLGTWQQIVVIDFDNRPRSRKAFLSIVT